MITTSSAGVRATIASRAPAGQDQPTGARGSAGLKGWSPEVDQEGRPVVVKSAAGAKGAEQLHAYWTVGAGRAKWVDSPTPWTTLYHHLVKFMAPEKAKATTSRWFIEVKGYAAGSDINRVAHGKPPRGKRVGPG